MVTGRWQVSLSIYDPGLEEALRARALPRSKHSGGAAAAAQRDLRRYYALLAGTLPTLRLSETEILLLATVLHEMPLAEAEESPLWIGVRARLERRGTRAEGLVRALAGLHPLQEAALLDALERAAVLARAGTPPRDALRKAGLAVRGQG